MTQLRRIVLAVAATAVVLACVGFAMGREVGIGATVGGLLSVANIWSLVSLVSALIDATKSGAQKAGAAGLLFAKMLGILVATAAVLGIFHVDPRGLALGFGASVVGLMIGATLVQFMPSPSGPAERSTDARA